jgi:hypothetical protein
METKRCSKCGIEKELSEYHKRSSVGNGHRAECKECSAALCREYHQSHQKEQAKAGRKYRQSHKIEEVERHRKYRLSHKIEITENSCKYYQSHKTKEAERSRKYGLTEKGKLSRKRRNHNRRARMKNTKATLTIEEWNKILTIQKNKCNICGKRFITKRLPTMDHIMPLSHGGNLSFGNVQALCQSCNSRKCNKLDIQFIQTWAHERK